MNHIRTEWRLAPDFAEVAEALGVTTKQVMACTEATQDRITVLYTPDPDPESHTLFSAWLARDSNGVLVLFGEPIERPGMWEVIVAEMERRFGDDA